MSAFDVIALLLTLSAAFAYLNYRFVRLPRTIGVMSIALALSLIFVAVNKVGGVGHATQAGIEHLLGRIDFNQLLLKGMLGFLLFAGAMHIDLRELARNGGAIAVLSTVGTVGSTFVVGLLTWALLRAVGLELRVIDCLLFGALISPTDPIAVLGILKTAGAPKSLETAIAGESLFNDGIGVVVFVVLLEVATGLETPTAGHVGLLFLREAAGGVAFGLALGLVAFRMIWRVNNYQVEVLITLAAASGGYALANALHVSGPLAVVVAGLLVGNHGRAYAMSPETRRHLDTFWELVDEVLNAVLFVLIGLEVLVMPFTWKYLLAALAVIPVALLARWASVSGTVAVLRRFRPFPPGAVTVMTWAGLRGGISVALALSLPQALGGPTHGPDSPTHQPWNVIVAITYAVVVFSIIVQGTTVGPLVRRLLGTQPGAAEP